MAGWKAMIWGVAFSALTAAGAAAVFFTFPDGKSSRVKSTSFWQDFWAADRAGLDIHLQRKIVPAPERVIEYLIEENRKDGFSAVPRPPADPNEAIRFIQRSLAGLPMPVRRKVESALVGIFVLEGLGNTGYTETVRDSDGRNVAAWVALSVDELTRTANEWATWKENSPFRPDSPYRLDLHIAAPTQDTKENAARFILLHEFGHVIGNAHGIHPAWDRSPPAEGLKPEIFPYSSISWRVAQKKHYARHPVDPLKGHPGFRFYAPKKSRVSLSKAPAIYQAIEESSLPSLYGATNIFDDFADGFATYVHTVMLGRPYRVSIHKGGELVTEFTGCWEKPRCTEKRTVLERILGLRQGTPRFRLER